MKFSVVWRPFVSASASPWRVLDERGREVAWANTFLGRDHLARKNGRPAPAPPESKKEN